LLLETAAAMLVAKTIAGLTLSLIGARAIIGARGRLRR
jgi:hypothetical protein